MAARGKIIVAVLVLAIVAYAIFALVKITPEIKPECRAGDSVCPLGCTYATDPDCAQGGVSSYGESHRCITERDCAAVKPICGNLRCSLTDVECRSDKFCITAINKDYKNAWNNARVRCVDPILNLVCPEKEYVPSCINGECRVMGG